MINPLPPADLVAELGRFRAEVADIVPTTAQAWRVRPAEDEWSLAEVMCHLRDVEREVHQARVTAILTEDNAFLAGVNADQWAEPRDYRSQDGPTAQRDYLAARDATIAMLDSLPADAWDRKGQHTFFGPTSLQELVSLITQHDRVHHKQLVALLDDESNPAAG